MRFEETKNKNLDKICHLQSLLNEKKNEEQGIRVLRKGGEEWRQECLWFKGSFVRSKARYELVLWAVTGEADEDTSGEQRVRAVYFVCGAPGRIQQKRMCKLREVIFESQHADQLLMNVEEAAEEEGEMETSVGSICLRWILRCLCQMGQKR
ncbi:uncharacterized protein MONOS_17818 [Monocercomonoides exilis]|uniref:uncharacterized protein n=1 Tax=Monocercomonoides exilis TaxID=2049356 RepID=UPI00355AC638|nr:hypothetical protein MONOS_17818 [Monocercomonoides exilis]